MKLKPISKAILAAAAAAGIDHPHSRFHIFF